MKRRNFLVLVLFMSFSLVATAEDPGWRARWDHWVTRAKVEFKKIEEKVRAWASHFLNKENKQSQKPTNKEEASQLTQTSSPPPHPSPKPSAPVHLPDSKGQLSSEEMGSKKRESILESEDRGTSSVQIQKMTKTLKDQSALEITSGRKGDLTLQRNKSGVVVIPKIKKIIRRLDIGTEDRLSAKELLGDKIQFNPVRLKSFKALPSPDLIDRKKSEAAIPKIIERVLNAKKAVAQIQSGNFPVTKEKIDGVGYLLTEVKPVQEKTVSLLPESELTLIASYLINEDRKSCHNMVGLLESIKNQPDYLAEAKYLMGQCELEMGLYSQYVDDMSSVLAHHDREFGSQALSRISQNVKFAFEEDVLQVARASREKFGPLSKETQDAIAFLQAKVAAHQFRPEETISYASQVSDKSPYFARAQFLLMSSQILLGKNKEAIEIGTRLLELLSKKGDSDKIEPLVHLNLGRAFYASKRYADAVKSYLKVKKDHPQWVQGLIEQGWAQIQSNDPAGAIGNMFSIQTNLFHKIYKPESFVVRSIGYLNICQYGDAFHTVRVFDRIHNGWSEQIKNYINSNKSPAKYYETVKNHLRNPNLTGVDGLPAPIVREMARHRDFINVQNSINELIDEIEQWKFIEGFFVKDLNRVSGKISRLKSESQSLKIKIAGTPKVRNVSSITPIAPMELQELKSQLSAVERRVQNLEFRISLIKKAQAHFRVLKEKGIALAAKKRTFMRQQAEKVLVQRLKRIKEELDQIIANNELLKYEIYAGSGENIRFNVAGGEKGAVENPDHVKDNSKNMKWEFDGEIWEDEIGNFRSSLENNCPKNKAKSARL